jgi:cell filamentation protein
MKEYVFSKYNHRDKIQSRYCYQDSDVLINKFNIRDPELLSLVETDLTSQRLSELIKNPVKGRFGIQHIINLHKYIFKDIYPFAGKIREEDISKGDTLFCKSEFIISNLENLMNKLKNDKYLAGLKKNEFSQAASFYMSELNIIHPFREGNGRVIREFIRCLAKKNNYILNWSLTDSEKLLEASIWSVDGTLEPLTRHIFESIEK